MTINIAFKTPDALVFATDGLASVMEVDADANERFLSNMASVEKLVPLSRGRLLAMFNGVGSLGEGTVATTLRSWDERNPIKPRESLEAYAARLNEALADHAHRRLGGLPRPFHLIVGGFEAGGGPPSIWSIKWPVDSEDVPPPKPVLQSSSATGVRHGFGAHYAGATEAVARYVEGFDPTIPERMAMLLAGNGQPDGPPGLLEQLAQEAVRASGCAPLSNAAAQALGIKYARKILQAGFHSAPREQLSEHFSLQAAVDYTVFLAQCAYARENLAPSRRGAPRVGSTLQVAYLTPGAPAELLAGIRLGIRVQGYEGEPEMHHGATLREGR